MVQGKITETGTPTIQLGASPSRLSFALPTVFKRKFVELCVTAVVYMAFMGSVFIVKMKWRNVD